MLSNTGTIRRSAAATRDTLDESLINRAAAGDRLAMQVLFTRHNVRVYRFALRIVHDRGIAEDLVSEVFFEAWQKAGTFAGFSQVTTWLLAITRHKALAALRRRQSEALTHDRWESIEDLSDGPEVAAHKQKNRSILSDCVSKLSPLHREIVDLVYYHDKTIDEVARILGVPQATVKTRMFYARRHLADSLRQRGIASVSA